jgi:hypothetical protein
MAIDGQGRFPVIRLWMVILSLLSFSALGDEFSVIKITPEFEEYLKRPKKKSLPKILGQSQLKSTKIHQSEFEYKIHTQLLGGNGGAGDFTGPFPDDEQSPLYQEIRQHLEHAHREIGLREVTQLDFINQQFDLGSSNFSGFSWQKPYGVVNVHADRQVASNLFGSNWLIQDTFTFDIEASTFLKKTNEAGITDMSQDEIGAFAGITFRRVYTYYHYADSYHQGLQADFSKLFLPFIKFNKNGINKLAPEEIIKRNDYWTTSAGGLISSAPTPGLSMSAGVLAQVAYENQVSVQHTPTVKETDEKYRLSVSAKTTASAAINLGLQIDFFRLLKQTILNFELAYEYSSTREYTLGMNSLQWEQISQTPPLSSELKSIMHGFGKIKLLEGYVVELQEDQSSALSRRGSLLIWGQLNKSKMEQTRVIKDEITKVFYKTYSQKMRVVQNIFSRLFSAVIYKIFKLPMGVKNAALYNREIEFEYEATHPQAADPKVARIDKTEQFSFIIKQSYEASRTDRWVERRYKKDLIQFVDSFTTLPKDYMEQIESEKLKGPMLIQSVIRIEKAGFDYLLQSSQEAVLTHIKRVCTKEIENQSCSKNLNQKFRSFKEDYELNHLKPSLEKFKSFLTSYFKKIKSTQDMVNLFGEENTFIHGEIRANTSQGAKFVTSFSTGQFRGLGVIDNFKRENGNRAPASIRSESL